MRSWLRSSCAIARSTGPAFAIHALLLGHREGAGASTSKERLDGPPRFARAAGPSLDPRRAQLDLRNAGPRPAVTRIDSTRHGGNSARTSTVSCLSQARRFLGGRRDSPSAGERHSLRFVHEHQPRVARPAPPMCSGRGVRNRGRRGSNGCNTAVSALRDNRVLALKNGTRSAATSSIELFGEEPSGPARRRGRSPETNLVLLLITLARAFATSSSSARSSTASPQRWLQTKR